ncbi:MAG: heme exporter protein CcmB [Rickettsiaceae bacterium]|nr:heme exporter protein CcmB [Rickettsiaceae bacterium]
MRKFSYLMFSEILLQNRLYKLVIYNIQFLLLGSICLFFISSNSYSGLGGFFLIAGLPIAALATSRNSIRDELSDGSLDLYMVTSDILQIIIAKFLGLFVCNIVSFAISLIISAIIYSMDYHTSVLIMILAIISLMQISAVSILLSSVEVYFRSKSNLVSFTVIPLMIPNLIITGMAISGDIEASSAIWILSAVSIIIIPSSLGFSGYLVRNIYNI